MTEVALLINSDLYTFQRLSLLYLLPDLYLRVFNNLYQQQNKVLMIKLNHQERCRLEEASSQMFINGVPSLRWWLMDTLCRKWIDFAPDPQLWRIANLSQKSHFITDDW